MTESRKSGRQGKWRYGIGLHERGVVQKSRKGRRGPTRRSRLRRGFWIAAVCFVVYVAGQVVILIASYSVLGTNMKSLAVLTNTKGRAVYQRELIGVCKLNGVTLQAEDIEIHLDTSADEIVISAPFRWRISLVLGSIEGQRPLTARTARWPDGAW